MTWNRIAATGWGLLLTVPLLAPAGCGGKEGPKNYTVSGTVEFDGKPVPKGFITFSPDAAKGNSGPGGGAEIKDGKFKTSAGKGVVGGAYIVKIVGTDGVPYSESGEDIPEGKPLFQSYQIEMEFPAEDTVKDFVVPKSDK